MPEPYSETQKRITKESVFTALIRLLEKKSFSELTITEITRLAGVSRAAFYRNYETKEDIIIFYLNDLFESLLTQLIQPENSDKLTRTSLYFEFFKTHRSFVEILIKADLTPIFYEQFCLRVTDFFKYQTNKFSKSSLHETYLPQYIASGLFRVLLEWIKGGTTESVEDISQFMFELTGSDINA